MAWVAIPLAAALLEPAVAQATKPTSPVACVVDQSGELSVHGRGPCTGDGRRIVLEAARSRVVNGRLRVCVRDSDSTLYLPS